MIGDEIYTNYKKYGLHYGKEFKRIDELYTDGFEVLAYIHPCS